jgi:gamma-glutamyl-gamma-aminobutyrate hydrolase PuuD
MGKVKSENGLMVGVSYNAEVGGAASNSVRDLIVDSGDTCIDIDYRIITPVKNDLDEIHTNPQRALDEFRTAKANAELLLTDVDCLILPGNGANIDPRFFKEDLKNPIDLPRSIAEMALAHVAIQKGLPILAICGGHQLVNTYLGGTTKDLSDDDSYLQGFMCYNTIIFSADSELGKVLKLEPVPRKFLQPNDPKNYLWGSFFGAHRQVVNKIGGEGMIMGEDYLQVVAVSPDSSHNIEAAENNYGAPLYSLQFHPEVGINGMYSVLCRGMAYKPNDPDQIKMNERIIQAFEQAGRTYQQRKVVNKEILQKRLASQPDKDQIVGNDNQELKNPNSNMSIRSMFMEVSKNDNYDTSGTTKMTRGE